MRKVSDAPIEEMRFEIIVLGALSIGGNYTHGRLRMQQELEGRREVGLENQDLNVKLYDLPSK
jgi:hypothetical protein